MKMSDIGVLMAKSTLSGWCYKLFGASHHSQTEIRPLCMSELLRQIIERDQSLEPAYC